jgi:hypothetical protein
VPPPLRFTFDVMSIAGGPRTLADIGDCVLCLYFESMTVGLWPGPVTFVLKHFSFLVRTCVVFSFASNQSGAPHAVNEPNVWHLHCSILFCLIVDIIIDPYDL